MISPRLFAALGVALAGAAAAQDAVVPTQVHIAPGKTPDQVGIQWTTFDDPPTTATDVVLGTDPSSLSERFTGSSFTFTDQGSLSTKRTMHLVRISGLEASTTYYYAVGDAAAGALSSVFSFTTFPDADAVGGLQRMVVYGDLGVENAQVTDFVEAEVAAGEVGLVVHVGDVAYDMYQNNGTLGDEWFDMVQGIAANTFYVVNQGNHEMMYNFSHYTYRFQNMPPGPGTVDVDAGSGLANNWYYSFNYGLAHIVTISTEVYFYDNFEGTQAQYNWLVEDLANANANRSEAPWIIVQGHRPLWCSCAENCITDSATLRDGLKGSDGSLHFGLEELFLAAGVDVYLAGHEHNYERMYDVSTGGKTTRSTTNPPATTFIVIGNAGNRENHEAFDLPKPEFSAKRINHFGYAHMDIYNATHMYWEHLLTDDEYPTKAQGAVVDSFWLVQESHGPFKGSTN